jgi:hypothetical protein
MRPLWRAVGPGLVLEGGEKEICEAELLRLYKELCAPKHDPMSHDGGVDEIDGGLGTHQKRTIKPMISTAPTNKVVNPTTNFVKMTTVASNNGVNKRWMRGPCGGNETCWCEKAAELLFGRVQRDFSIRQTCFQQTRPVPPAYYSL